jgi:transcriptional regulator with GAF, ATPase, and Fis domain
VYLTLIEEYLSDPKYYFIRSVSLVMNEKKKEHIAVLTEQRIEAYALLPIYYNNKIAGLLEVYSKEKNSISENILEKLKTALPLLAQLMQNEIDEFKNDINNVIRDKFTAMQAAVQWKFNEVA